MCYRRGPALALIGEEIDKHKACRAGILFSAVLQLIIGACAIIIWAVMLVWLGDYRHGSAIKSYAGIWVGAIVFVPGIAGVLAAGSCLPPGGKATSFYVGFGGSIATLSVAGQLLRYAFSAFFETRDYRYVMSRYTQDILNEYATVEIAFGFILLAAAIVYLCMYGCVMYRLKARCQAGRGVCPAGQQAPQNGAPQNGAPTTYWDPNKVENGKTGEQPPPYVENGKTGEQPPPYVDKSAQPAPDKY